MLTDTQCRNAQPKGKTHKLTDSHGLYLEVKPNRSKVWRYRFELLTDGEKKEGTFTIGDYIPPPRAETEEEAAARRAGGRLTLTEAREERNKARALVKQGISPVQSRQLDKINREAEKAVTFESVAREWVALKDWTQDTKARRVDMLARVVFPKIGALPVKSVKPAHILDVMNTASKNNGPSIAQEAKRAMSGVFELAIATLRADTDPVYPVRKALPKNKTQHKRALTIAEIGALMRDISGYERNFQTVAAFRLMWWTLCRPSEAIGARWEEFDLDAATWRIPAERMKRRREHVTPLPSQAVDMLRRVHAISGNREHLFPHRDERDKPMCSRTFGGAIKYMGWAGKYSPHATRTTGSTRLNESGFPRDWVERQLAHEEPNRVRAAYNHAEHQTDRAVMLQQWADMLDSWEKGASVTPIKAAA